MHIKVPLVDILQGIPKYPKHITGIVANKSQFTQYATIALTEEFASQIQKTFANITERP